MKNFDVPSRQLLADTYRLLQIDVRQGRDLREFETNLCRYAAWSRLDPRLGEILVMTLAAVFAKLNPFVIWELNRQCPEPATLAVILEFVTDALQEPGDEDSRRAFLAWSQTILHDVQPAPFQFFFISEGAPRPQRLAQELMKSLKTYTKWGFAGEDSLLPSKLSRVSSLSMSQRQQILSDLILRSEILTVADYVNACNGRVSRRTAERDLATHSSLRARGFTRNRDYKIKR